jgi:hypothetical protein
MQLEFERKAKNKMVAIRLTDEEFLAVEKIAKMNDVALMEASRQLIRASLKELKLL